MRSPVRVAVFAALFAITGATTPVLAASPDSSFPGCRASDTTAPKTIVINGQEYGARDGLRVDSYECAIRPGSGPVGATFGSDQPSGHGSVPPMIVWGASYAISTEWGSQLGYDGKARAAANISNGQRIIQVCMWYERNNSKVSGVYCSTAVSMGGSWISGNEATMSCWDSLLPWEVTVFHWSRVLINP